VVHGQQAGRRREPGVRRRRDERGEAHDRDGRRGRRVRVPRHRNAATSDSESWTYDAFGRTATHVDFKLQSTKYVYDDTGAHAGRLREEQRFTGAIDSSPDEKTVYDYDDLGRREQIEEYEDTSLTRNTSYGYDALTGGVSMVDAPEGVIRYAYDRVTGRAERTYTADNDTTYGYDGLGRLGTVTATKLNGQSLTSGLITSYTYDEVGNLDIVLNNNGTPADATDDLTHDYAYDALNRLDTLTVKRGSVNAFAQDFTLASDGQRELVAETRYKADGTAGYTVTIDWTYDALNRLTGEAHDSSDDTKDYTATYKFDLSGNRKEKVQTGFGAATTTYEYNDREQLTSDTTGGAATTHAYDANGSMTAKGGDTYAWDLRNRMETATVGGTTTTYGYDHEGQRVSQKTGADPTTYYVNHRNNPSGYPQILEEKQGSTPQAATLNRSYVLGLRVEGQSEGAGTRRFARDGHGSVRALVDPQGKVVERYDYQAFGEPVRFDRLTSSSPETFTAMTAADAALRWGRRIRRGQRLVLPRRPVARPTTLSVFR
jgi:YD repeat-containing protein